MYEDHKPAPVIVSVNTEELPNELPQQPELASRTKSADNTGKLLWVLLMLFAVYIAPNVASRFQYALTEAEERARMDVARANLKELNLDQISTAFRLVADAVEPSVVNIRTGSGHSNRRGGGPSEGSGVIVDKEGYIVTNHHVVANQPTVQIQLHNGRRGVASLVGYRRAERFGRAEDRNGRPDGCSLG